MKMSVRRLTVDAVLAALCFVLSAWLSIPAGPMKFTLSGLPILIGAFLFGPVDGMIIGGVGELLSQLVSPYGITVTTPLWILPAVLRGLLVGLVALFMHYALKQPLTSITIVVSNLFVTAVNGLVIWADAVIMGYYSYAYVFGSTAWRFLASVITAVVYCAIVPPIVEGIRKAGFGRSDK